MHRRMWFVVGLLLTVSLSCSLWPGGRSADEAEEPSAVATTDVSPEEAVETLPVGDSGSEEPGATLSVDEDSLDQLSSYRAVMSWNVDKEDGTSEDFSIQQTATRDPAAKQLTMVSEDEAVELIQIGSDMWMRFGDDWMRTSSDDVSIDSFGDVLQTSDGWIADLDDSEYDYIGRETANGIQTQHYRSERSEHWGTFFGMLGAGGEAESGVADVWVADEAALPRFVVRFAVEVSGEIDGVAATMTLNQDVSAVNEPLVIDPPEGVALGGLPEGVPIYPDATEVTQFGTMTTFTVAADLETVNGFYNQALTAAGWTLEGEPTVVEGTAMSSWVKAGQGLTLMISTEDGGVSTSVVVVLEEGE